MFTLSNARLSFFVLLEQTKDIKKDDLHSQFQITSLYFAHISGVFLEVQI